MQPLPRAGQHKPQAPCRKALPTLFNQHPHSGPLVLERWVSVHLRVPQPSFETVKPLGGWKRGGSTFRLLAQAREPQEDHLISLTARVLGGKVGTQAEFEPTFG